MSYPKYVHAAVTLVLLIAAAVLIVAYRAEHRAQLQLTTQLKSAEQSASEATAREKSRDEDLVKSLTAIAKQKSTIQQPAQILKTMPDVLPLPTPLTLATEIPVPSDSATQPSQSPDPKITLPIQDLKPLYDFALDCRSCQAKLATAQADLKDEQLKSQTLSRERDDALRVVHGGSVAQRIVRAAKWYALGAAAGAVAAKIAHTSSRGL